MPHIYEMLIDNFMNLSVNSNGIGVIKKIIKFAKSDLTIAKIQKIILENFKYLIFNVYGNYAIQVALENWNKTLLSPLISLFYNGFYEYSLNKFSSNVVEKCIEFGGEEVISKFIEEISNKSKIVELMKNNFGNFVVQKVLKMSNSDKLKKLTNLILKNIENIGEKKLILKWKTIIKTFEENHSLNNNKLMSNNNNNFYFIYNVCNNNYLNVNNNNINDNNIIFLTKIIVHYSKPVKSKPM